MAQIEPPAYPAFIPDTKRASQRYACLASSTEAEVAQVRRQAQPIMDERRSRTGALNGEHTMDIQTQKDRLAADMKLVMTDLEALLLSTANQANGEMEEWQSRLRDRMSDMKQHLADMEHSAVDKAKAAGRVTNQYVHEHPWRSIAIAAGVGALVGVAVTMLRR